MFPGMNNRQLKKAMKKMGIKEQSVEDAVAVIIRTKKEDIIIRNPEVSKVNMMGTWTYQVSGEEKRRPIEPEKPEFSEEDIETVMDQAGCSKEKAASALEESEGDLALAILSLKEE
ncbi:nascent polypeptide-associated complex protein [Candidatus Woesearchaeota archaeon]|nr:nascent polypeptide-associated complex protein [Candidatus Woesearchaeota archaeon]